MKKKGRRLLFQVQNILIIYFKYFSFINFIFRISWENYKEVYSKLLLQNLI